MEHQNWLIILLFSLRWFEKCQCWGSKSGDPLLVYTIPRLDFDILRQGQDNDITTTLGPRSTIEQRVEVLGGYKAKPLFEGRRPQLPNAYSNTHASWFNRIEDICTSMLGPIQPISTLIVINVSESNVWFANARGCQMASGPISNLPPWRQRHGYLKLIQQALRVRPDGLGAFGIPCGSYIFLNSPTHQRDAAHPFGNEDLGYIQVANLSMPEFASKRLQLQPAFGFTPHWF